MSSRFGRVGVVLGGTSSEREISLRSGDAVYNALLRAGIDAVRVDSAESSLLDLKSRGIDRVFLMLHGKTGEDGTVQGALELQGLPYTGSGVLASALAMDKVMCKKIWLHDGLPTPDFTVLEAGSDFAGIIEKMGSVFVKPVNEGSSIGINRADTAQALRQAYEDASRYDDTVMAERRIEGREFTVPVIAGKVLPAIELEVTNAFYDFAAKYVSEDTRYLCPCSLDSEELEELNRLCLAACRAIECRGWGRVDAMRDSEGRFWLLEVNTIPGMTDHSLVPMSAAAAGMDMETLVVKILETTLPSKSGQDAS